MRELVFLLEEASARELLSAIVPRLFPSGLLQTRFIVFEGKQDLHKQLTRKLRSYINSQAEFVVLRDQDQADCLALKRDLVKLCMASGKPNVTVRIACKELEAFYLGDLIAVEKGLGIRGLAKRQGEARFRAPDRIQQPSAELETLTSKRYQKVSGTRAIAPHLNLDHPRSASFALLLRTIRGFGR